MDGVTELLRINKVSHVSLQNNSSRVTSGLRGGCTVGADLSTRLFGNRMPEASMARTVRGMLPTEKLNNTRS